MSVILWGESSLYVNPANVFNTLTKVLSDGKDVSVRKDLEGTPKVQIDAPTNRNGIQDSILRQVSTT